MVVKTLGGLLEEFRGHGQISLGASNSDMTQIRTEESQSGLDVFPLLIPAFKTVDGKDVPKVMNPRSPAALLGFKSQLSQGMSEEPFNGALRVRSSPMEVLEEKGLGATWEIGFFSELEIPLQFLRHTPGEGNEARFMKLCFININLSLSPIYVLKAKVQGLAQSHPRRIEK